MCAIAGLVGLDAEEKTLDRMLKTMARRGPDDRGVSASPGCTLLHTRLAIIDPAGGKQPMRLTHNGETYTLVYNGELYNTAEIRAALQKLGHRFLGHSDTEVVLHAYAQWGAGCVERLNGIFAFGIWEQGRGRLFLARDRIGVKPLFYAEHGNGLLFASEIKTILAFHGFKTQLDREGAAQLILLGPGRLPGSGVFHGIRELEPGCLGYWEKGVFGAERYWSLKDREHRETFDETVEHTRFLVTDAIQRQMVSDVPIGTFLSGGLDSSIITALCAGQMAARGERLKTFSVDYRDNDRYFRPGKFQPNSDGEYIHIMCEALDTDHSRTELTPEELVGALEESTIARDLPGMADVDFSLLVFCRRIRENVKVALSGECADEIFGGYPWYRDPEVRALAGFPWAQNTQDRAEMMAPEAVRGLDPREFVMDAYRQTVAKSDILPGTSPLERRMKEMVNLNFRWFMQTLLDRKDRMSMYSGLEVRVPFCDYRIAEYLYTVPWAYKDWQGREKGLLRQAVAGLLPEPVRLRKKSPYPKTFDPAYEKIMAERLNNLLADKSAPIYAIVRREKLESLIGMDSPWPWYGQLMLRPQTMAYFLQLDFWLRHYQVELLF